MPNKGITIYCIQYTEAALKLCKWTCLLLKVMELFPKMINDHKVIFIGNLSIQTGESMKLDNHCLNLFPHITSQPLNDISMDFRRQRKSRCSDSIFMLKSVRMAMPCRIQSLTEGDYHQLSHHWKKY